MDKKSIFGSAVVLISGTGFAQLVALLALPVITRLYTPADFGLFAVYAAILSLGTVVVCLRYELAMVLPKKDGTALLVYKLCLFATLLSTVLMALMVLFAGESLASLYSVSPQSPLFWFIPLSLLVGGLYKAGMFWHTRKKNYRRLAVAKISQSVPQTMIQLLLGLTTLGVVGLIIGEIAGKACGVLALRRKYPGRVEVKKKITAKRLVCIAAAYKHFPLVSSWSTLINQLGVVAPAIFIAASFGAEVAGWYAMAQRLLAVPMDLIGQSIMSLYIGEFSALKRENPQAMQALFGKFLSRMFLAGVIPVLAILAAGDWLFTNVLGAEWEEAATYAKVLVFAFWFRFAVSPLSQTLNLIERQDIQLGWDVARMILVAIGFTAVLLFDLSAIITVVIYTGVVIVAQVSYALITYYQLRRISLC